MIGLSIDLPGHVDTVRPVPPDTFSNAWEYLHCINVPDHYFFSIYPSACFSVSSASMDSDRSRREKIPRLVHGPSQKASVKSKICSGDSAASSTATRSSLWANNRVKLALIATRRLGCVTSVSPVGGARAVRVSGQEAKRVQNEKKKKKRDKKFDQRAERMSRRRTPNEAEASPAIARVCCSPGILFSSDAAFVDCIQSRRRRPAAVTAKQRQEVVLHFSPLFEESPSTYDRFREWRLDIEDMSYEELLELSDSIGHECTGLKENEMVLCLRKAKIQMEEMLPLLLRATGEWKCSICQDGFESGNEMGRLDCGHSYHIGCLKQWLRRKNSCPVCKDDAVPYKPWLEKSSE